MLCMRQQQPNCWHITHMMLSLLLVTFNARGSTELGYCLLVRTVKQAYYDS